MKFQTVCWKPIRYGVLIGLIITASFYVAGRGIGVSGAIAKLAISAQNAIAPSLSASNEYLSAFAADGKSPFDDFLVIMLGGLVLGSLISALLAKDVGATVLRGPRMNVPGRLFLALAGGIFVGFGTRLARGCSSGLALVGGSELSVGAFAFMFAVFAGGFLSAYFVRRQWL